MAHFQNGGGAEQDFTEAEEIPIGRRPKRRLPLGKDVWKFISFESEKISSQMDHSLTKNLLAARKSVLGVERAQPYPVFGSFLLF